MAVIIARGGVTSAEGEDDKEGYMMAATEGVCGVCGGSGYVGRGCCWACGGGA